MSTPLKRKLEKAFKLYLESEISASDPLDGVNIYEGRGNLDARQLPSVTIYVESLEENIQPGIGEYLASLAIIHMGQADDETVSDHDARQQQLEEIIADVTSAKDFINKSATPDVRTVPNIYIYDIKEDTEDQDFEERSFIDSLRYQIPCRNDNGDGTITS